MLSVKLNLVKENTMYNFEKTERKDFESVMGGRNGKREGEYKAILSMSIGDTAKFENVPKGDVGALQSCLNPSFNKDANRPHRGWYAMALYKQGAKIQSRREKNADGTFNLHVDKIARPHR